MKPEIIFEDSDILVINKPAGLIVNRADTTVNQTTIQEWVEEKLNMTEKNHESEFAKRGGIVHRLDKETSGILIIAKNEEAFLNLQKQFKEGTVEKTYSALVHGKVIISEGEISVPIGRLPWNRMRFGILPAGRESKTLYKVESNLFITDRKKTEELTLVKAFPKTGRTHQIRVHFQYLGNPLFGDSLYAGRKTIKRDRKLLNRHFLHAAHISFTHPKSGEKLEFDSKLPKELENMLSILSKTP